MAGPDRDRRHHRVCGSPVDAREPWRVFVDRVLEGVERERELVRGASGGRDEDRRRERSSDAGRVWRFGLGRLYRDPVATTFQISAIGLGLTVLVTLSLVRGELFDSGNPVCP